ncbi:hypothetical protein KAJ87_03015 [Candidatus Pacearchaeota archaeon]|nr:hypothetical protein [Candidatus Pacearchaeota archaeon]
MKINEFFKLTWKKIWILVVGGFVCISLHNLIYALFKFEEAFFFSLVVFVLPVYFVIALVYTFIKTLKRKRR